MKDLRIDRKMASRVTHIDREQNLVDFDDPNSILLFVSSLKDDFEERRPNITRTLGNIRVLLAAQDESVRSVSSGESSHGTSESSKPPPKRRRRGSAIREDDIMVLQPHQLRSLENMKTEIHKMESHIYDYREARSMADNLRYELQKTIDSCQDIVRQVRRTTVDATRGPRRRVAQVAPPNETTKEMEATNESTPGGTPGNPGASAESTTSEDERNSTPPKEAAINGHAGASDGNISGGAKMTTVAVNNDSSSDSSIDAKTKSK